MNKYKKNLELMRFHLGRDTRGLALLDEISRDICEQRKMIAALQESGTSALARAENDQQELVELRSQLTRLKSELECEKSKRLAVDSRFKLQAERIAQMEAEVNDDSSVEVDGEWESNVAKLLKDVRHRYKVIPTAALDTSGSFCTDDFVKHFTGDEFMRLGMVMALHSIFAARTTLVSERHFKHGKFLDSIKVQMARWLRPIIRPSPIEKKLRPCHWDYDEIAAGKLT